MEKKVGNPGRKSELMPGQDRREWLPAAAWEKNGKSGRRSDITGREARISRTSATERFLIQKRETSKRGSRGGKLKKFARWFLAREKTEEEGGEKGEELSQRAEGGLRKPLEKSVWGKLG